MFFPLANTGTVETGTVGLGSGQGLGRKPRPFAGGVRAWPVGKGRKKTSGAQTRPRLGGSTAFPQGPAGPAPGHDLCLLWTIAPLPGHRSPIWRLGCHSWLRNGNRSHRQRRALPAWVRKAAGRTFPPPQRPSPAPSSPHTHPTSIWRDISPSPAPVTSIVVAQPTQEGRRMWFSKETKVIWHDPGCSWEVSRKRHGCP